MIHLKLYENFNSKIDYCVKKVGNDYKIFALTPQMREEGNYEHQDAATLFGNGSFWRNYSSWEEAYKVIKSMEVGKDFPELEDF